MNNIGEKLYYPISEVAEMFNKPAHTIRYWETEFDILNPHKNKKGDRFFTPEDVANIEKIIHLQEEGISNPAIKKMLKEQNKKVDNKITLIEKLKEIKATLIGIRNEIEN